MDLSNNIYIVSESPDKLIIVFREPKNTNKDQINEYFDYLTQLSNNKKFHLIIDLSQTKPPSSEVRATLKQRFQILESNILSYQVYVGNNLLLKIAVKFVGASIGLQNFKLVNSIEEAQKRIHEGV